MYIFVDVTCVSKYLEIDENLIKSRIFDTLSIHINFERANFNICFTGRNKSYVQS